MLQEEVLRQVDTLNQVLIKGKRANDNRVAHLIDGLITMAPGAVMSAFAHPILTAMATPLIS